MECNEALGSDYCSTESSSSDSSTEKKKTQCKKKKLAYLISSTSTDSVSGCDGGIFTSPILAPQSYGIKPIYHPQPFPTYQTQFRISGPISRTFPLFVTDSSSLASFATTCGSLTAYCIILLLPPNVAEHRSLLVVYWFLPLNYLSKWSPMERRAPAQWFVTRPVSLRSLKTGTTQIPFLLVLYLFIALVCSTTVSLVYMSVHYRVA